MRSIFKKEDKVIRENSSQKMQPWMDEREVEMISKYLTPETVVLEYGCGGSTQFFSERVREVVSIEHNKEWADKVKEQNLSNVSFFYTPPNFEHDGFEPAQEGQFQDYVDTPRKKSDQKFDVVLIDGRARVACALEVYSLLKPEGVLFFHDFYNRERYYEKELFEKYEIIEGVTVTRQTLAVFGKK